jgi:hypothetical protein
MPWLMAIFSAEGVYVMPTSMSPVARYLMEYVVSLVYQATWKCEEPLPTESLMKASAKAAS